MNGLKRAKIQKKAKNSSNSQSWKMSVKAFKLNGCLVNSD